MRSDKYIIIISGLSGAGKTTVAEGLIERLGNLEMSRSATTRPKRNDGKEDEYVYLTDDEFRASIACGDVLEYTEYGGNLYGTRKSEFERIFSMGRYPILVLDYVGVKSLRELLDYPVYAFYVYTSLAEAEKRLYLRDMSDCVTEKVRSTFERRLGENRKDYSSLSTFADRYDAFVENCDMDRCIDEICVALDELKQGRATMTDEDRQSIISQLSSELNQ